MKTEMRKGTIVKSLIDGELYKIISVGNSETILAGVKCDEQNDTKEYKETSPFAVSVSTEVAEDVFYTVASSEPEVPDMTDWKIEGQRLWGNGKKIETGTLVPVEILAMVPGGVILTVQSRTDGKLDLFRYDVDEDKFNAIGMAEDSYQIVYQGPAESIVGVLATGKNEESVAVPGGDPVKKEKVGQTFRLYAGCNMIFCAGSEEETMFGSNLFLGEYREDAMMHVLLFAHFDPESGRTTVHTVNITFYDDDDVADVVCHEVAFNGSVKDFMECKESPGDFVFVTEDGIVHSNFGHGKRCALGEEVLEAVRDYPIPIGLNFTNRKDTEFVFANANYGVCKIRVVKTIDRGFVTTIMEFKH